MNEQTDKNTKKNAQRNRERANELMRAWTHSEKNTQKTMKQGIHLGPYFRCLCCSFDHTCLLRSRVENVTQTQYQVLPALFN